MLSRYMSEPEAEPELEPELVAERQSCNIRVAALDTWPHTVWLVSREAPLVYPPLSHAQP